MFKKTLILLMQIGFLLAMTCESKKPAEMNGWVRQLAGVWSMTGNDIPMMKPYFGQ
jgi:hypothetical protein